MLGLNRSAAPSGIEMVLFSLLEKAGINPQQIVAIVQGVAQNLEVANERMRRIEEKVDELLAIVRDNERYRDDC